MPPTAVFALLVDIVMKDRQIVHNVHHRSILIRDHRVVRVVVQTDIMIIFFFLKLRVFLVQVITFDLWTEQSPGSPTPQPFSVHSCWIWIIVSNEWNNLEETKLLNCSKYSCLREFSRYIWIVFLNRLGRKFLFHKVNQLIIQCDLLLSPIISL